MVGLCIDGHIYLDLPFFVRKVFIQQYFAWHKFCTGAIPYESISDTKIFAHAENLKLHAALFTVQEQTRLRETNSESYM